MTALAGLADLRRHLALESAGTTDDARLLHALEAATERLEAVCMRRFLPRRDTLTIRADGAHSFTVEHDLLEVSALSDDAGPVDLAVIGLAPVPSAASVLYRTDGQPFTGEVTLTALTGWHRDRTRAFISSGDAVQSPALTSSSTTITVASVSAADGRLRSPRFQPGGLLRIEGELMPLLRVDSLLNRVDVSRGAHGTTAAAHGVGAVIECFDAPDSLRALCLQWAAALLRGDAPPEDALIAAAGPFRRVAVR